MSWPAIMELIRECASVLRWNEVMCIVTKEWGIITGLLG